MARLTRLELEGGLYHLITRGNNRQRIFHDSADYQKFLALLRTQKQRLPFFLYAYCLMSNHVHLLIERQADTVGRIMHRVLTGYSQYYNRKHRKVGHVLQGRHQSILCQTDQYLSELVRYIHLNPVRAKMVSRPEQYEFSSHRAYLGLEPSEIVDVDPVLRHFGAKKQVARKNFSQFVRAGKKLGHREDFYQATEQRVLGTEEFVDATIHRIGQVPRERRSPMRPTCPFNAAALIAAVEHTSGFHRSEFCGPAKKPAIVKVKEGLILVGKGAGASLTKLAEITSTSSSTISRRHDAARLKTREHRDLGKLVREIRSEYEKRISRD
jgi:REP-associated tyrosine transposase